MNSLSLHAVNVSSSYEVSAVNDGCYQFNTEARESLYWIDLLHRNNYIDDKQYHSIYTDCEELVKILVSRCKKLDQQISEGK